MRFRGIGIGLAMLAIIVGLVMPILSTNEDCTLTKDNIGYTGTCVVKARPLDVSVIFTDTNIPPVTTTVNYQYSEFLDKPGYDMVNLMMGNLGYIWCALLVFALISLGVEYYRAEEWGETSQYAVLAAIFVGIALVMFYFLWNQLILAQNPLQIHTLGVTTRPYTTNLDIGFYGAMMSMGLMIAVAITSKDTKPLKTKK